MFPALLAAARSPTPGRPFCSTALIGLTNGALFALVALGYTMVYGIIELINFAHGDVFMLGSFLALTLVGLTGLERRPIGRQLWLGIGLLLLVVPLFCAHAQRGDRPPGLQAAAQRAEAGAAGLGHRRVVRA